MRPLEGLCVIERRVTKPARCLKQRRIKALGRFAIAWAGIPRTRGSRVASGLIRSTRDRIRDLASPRGPPGIQNFCGKAFRNARPEMSAIQQNPNTSQVPSGNAFRNAPSRGCEAQHSPDTNSRNAQLWISGLFVFKLVWPLRRHIHLGIPFRDAPSEGSAT